MTAIIALPHPGVVLGKEFLEPMDMFRLCPSAKAIRVTRSRINEDLPRTAGDHRHIALRLRALLRGRCAKIHETCSQIRSARAAG